MKPSLMSASSFNSRGKVARPDCLTTFEFEGAVLSCSIVHFESPLPVLVAVQPFGAAPIASASKLAVLSAMAPASTEQGNATAMKNCPHCNRPIGHFRARFRTYSPRRHVTRKIEMIHLLRLYFCLGTVFIS